MRMEGVRLSADAEPTLCKNQTFDFHSDEEQSCMPQASNFPSDTVFHIECITDTTSPLCIQV